MTALKNSVRLIGCLENNPLVKVFENKKNFARVNLSTDETEIHTLVMWGKRALFAKQNLRKGAEVAIEGKLVNRIYADKAGELRSHTEIKVNEIYIFRR